MSRAGYLWLFNLIKAQLIMLACAPALLMAHSGDSCYPAALRGFNDRAPVYVHESPSFKVLGKRWSTSAELKAYFDQQRSLLKYLSAQPLPKKYRSKLKFAAAGDLMRLPHSQTNWVGESLKQYFDSVDVLTANLETLISKRYSLAEQGLYDMNSDPALLTGFHKAGGGNYFSLLSMANNHVFDYPDDAIQDTLAFLQQEGIAQSGIRVAEKTKPYVIFEHNGMRIGYYSVTTFVNKMQIKAASQLKLNPMVEGLEPVPFADWSAPCEVDLGDIQAVLKHMQMDGADLRIISIHWGVEHDMYPQPMQVELAHRMVKLGADIIIGSHPHVLQPVETCFVNGYEQRLNPDLAKKQQQQGCIIQTKNGQARKALIYYSLGNLTSFSPFFWQQLGTIAELQLVKEVTAGAHHVDWFQPQFVFTYDQVEHPPNGKRYLDLLTRWQQTDCYQKGCDQVSERLVKAAENHLFGVSLSWWQALKIYALTSYQAIKAFTYWALFAEDEPAKDKELVP